MDKITIERETLLPCPFCGDDGDKGRQEVTQMIEGRNKFARITCRACGAMCPEENWNRRAALAQKAEPPSMPQGKSLALLDLDSVEHMQGGANGPTIRLRGFINVQTGPTAPQPPIDNAFVAEGCEQFSQPADIVNPISQQEPVAYRHSKTGQLYDSEEEVPLADGDEWAEPLYAAPVAQQEPAAWRQWSSKLHDWDYQTNRGDLRPDTPADPLFVAAAQPATTAVPPGMALVPIEPTPEIITTGTVALMKASDSDLDATREEIAATYRAMIAAAGDKP